MTGPLNTPAVCVLLPELPGGEDRPARAVFPLLKSWAVDESTLRLELPASEFAEPERIVVWFLRDGDLLWTEKALWPGKSAPAKPQPAAKPAKAVAKQG
jgi:hypothetical protein